VEKRLRVGRFWGWVTLALQWSLHLGCGLSCYVVLLYVAKFDSSMRFYWLMSSAGANVLHSTLFAWTRRRCFQVHKQHLRKDPCACSEFLK